MAYVQDIRMFEMQYFGDFEGADTHLGRGGITVNSDSLVTLRARIHTWAEAGITVNSNTLVTLRARIHTWAEAGSL